MSKERLETVDTLSYTAASPLYAMSLATNASQHFRAVVGTFIEDQNNRIEVVEEIDSQLKVAGTMDHIYPATKLMWAPDSVRPDLFASSSDCLRLWSYDAGIAQRAKLTNSRLNEYSAPLTSFDWNEIDPNVVGTSSIDTTCTIWNIETEVVTTQLIAHDKEVYDIAFGQSPYIFASVGADGSVRQFDLRSMDHSTVLFEHSDVIPLLRLAWNKQDHNYLATITMDSSVLFVLDVRAPSGPVAKLEGHSSCINAIAWAPHSSFHLCSAGDDNQALIWNLQTLASPTPILAYSAEAEINSLQWSRTHPEWVSIVHSRTLQLLKV
jgi:WD repeat-containing protein 68